MSLEKTVILAICGKSAAGKDHFAKWIAKDLKRRDLPVHTIVTDTTRPIRQGEKNGVDYNFLTPVEFLARDKKGYYAEVQDFRNWFYGTPIDCVKEGMVNVGVFSPESIEILLAQWNSNYFVIPIYIKANFFLRFSNARSREKGHMTEFIRRTFREAPSFIGLSKKLKEANRERPLIFTNAEYGVLAKADRVRARLIELDIL